MKEVDINTLVNNDYELNQIISNNVIIIGEIYKINIRYNYDKLNLFNVNCTNICYSNQKGDSIKNHILPNSLLKLNCSYNQLTSLPDLPNSLLELYCANNRLTSLPNLPNSLETLDCPNNELTSLPDLSDLLEYLNCSKNQLTSFTNVQIPNSLRYLYCDNNQLTLFPDLPNSLKDISCVNNQLIYLPNLNKINIIITNCKIKYIKYDPEYEGSNINFFDYYDDKLLHNSYIEIKDYGRITSNDEYIQYMEKVKLSKIKSARK